MQIKRQIQGACLSVWSAAAKLVEAREEPKACEFSRPIRMAFVKQNMYRDLYFQSGPMTAETIFSSEGRSGPVGLLEDEIDADFHVVDVESDPECQVFQEKPTGSGSPEAVAKRKAQWGRLESVSVPAREIDWGAYDLVWAMENAVPADITKQFPQVFWATMLEDHSMPSYGRYLRQVPKGYDVFFNQAYGPSLRSLYQAAHVVDWPYAFLKHDSIQKLFPAVSSGEQVAYDLHQDVEAIEALLNSRNWTFPECIPGQLVETRAFLENLVASRVYWAVEPSRPLWGNAAAEAISAGCVVMANASMHWNSAVLAPALRVNSLGKALELTDQLFGDEAFFRECRRQLEARLDWHCFFRPLKQLASRAAKSPRSLSIKDAIA